MKDLPAIIFIAPLLALIIVTLLFFDLKNKNPYSIIFSRFIIILIIVSYILNLSWEIIQAPLYNGIPFSTHHILLCALGSIADVIMVLLIYLTFAELLKNPFWIKNIKTYQIILIILIGGLGAILGEYWHTASGNWNYKHSMPLIPFTRVGLTPVFQFMFLPIISFQFSYKVLKKLVVYNW